MGNSSTPAQPFLYAVPCEDQEKAPNSTPVFRSPDTAEGLVVNFEPPYSTLYQVFKTACMRYPMHRCLG